MRIGLISGEYVPMQGGVADFTREIARSFVALGHDVFILTGESGVGENDAGITVNACVRNWNMSSLFHVRPWARDNRLDVVNLQYQTAAYHMAGLVHLLPRLLGKIPCVVTFHDLRVPYLFPKAGPLRRRAVHQLAVDADAAIVTNYEDEQQLGKIMGTGRVQQVPIGSNIHSRPRQAFDRDMWRARLGVSRDEKLLAYFGFLNSSKGVDTLLKALARATSEGVPFRLLMLGGRTGSSDPTNVAYAGEIDALIDDLAIGSHVLWTGYVNAEEVSGYLYASDLCVLPFKDGVSFRRGTFMAALVHGCPTITTFPAVPTPELLDGENVLLVPADSVDDLVDAMKTLATNSRLAQRIGAGAQELAGQFTWERIAAQTLRLFDRLCCPGESPR